MPEVITVPIVFIAEDAEGERFENNVAKRERQRFYFTLHHGELF